MSVQEELAQALAPEFEVVRLIGEGTMGRVYLGREAALGRPVAIKVLRREVAPNQEARKRFEREARAAAKLTQRNVATVYRTGETEGQIPYLVMEYVKGRNLEDALESRGRLDGETSLTVLEQMAEALGAAHKAGIIHRDVKPANVMWDADAGRAVLTDFGIAGILQDRGETVTKLTQAGFVVGDPTAMSPEQLRGDPLTEATDIYSLGILGYRLLTGEGPYDASTPMQLTIAHLNDEPRKLQELDPSVDPGLADLLQRCLAKKPEHRPRAKDVARAVSALRHGGPEARVQPQPTPGSLESVPAIKRFLEELKRRRVYNVIAVYVAFTFLLLQVAELVLPPLPLPEGTYNVVVAIVLAGFPVALALAWTYDITKSGIRRSESVPRADRAKLLVFQVIGLTLSLAAAVAIGWWVLGS